jgi:putative membrane-associated lipoprotein
MNRKLIPFLLIAGALLTNCGGSRDEDVINPNTPGNTQPSNPTTPSTPTNEKPSDEEIGRRTYAQEWKTGVDYLSAIDIADLYNNPANVSAALKNSVKFATLTTDQKYYTLKDDDLSYLSIEDITYDKQYISFYTKYKGIKSSTKSTLKFDARDFYNKQFTTNNSYVSSKYMRGLYESLPIGIGSLFSYDSQRYQIDYVADSKDKSDSNNSLSLSIKITDKKILDNSKNTFEIHKNVEGFRTLKNLADDLTLGHNFNFREKVKDVIKKHPSKTDLTQNLKGFFDNNWYKLISISLKSKPSVTLSIDGQSPLYRTISGQSVGYIDIYLTQPRFVLTSAVIDRRNLVAKVKLQDANEVPIDKEYTVMVPNVK